MNYYFCFFHIHSLKHVNYHHVIIKADSDKEITGICSDTYQYELISTKEIGPFSEDDLKNEVYRRLIMDGESLLKRIKKNRKKLLLT